MKQHTVPALGLLLSGCAVQGNSQPDVPADNVVDQMIAVNTQKVSFVQQQLIAALTPCYPHHPAQPRRCHPQKPCHRPLPGKSLPSRRQPPPLAGRRSP